MDVSDEYPSCNVFDQYDTVAIDEDNIISVLQDFIGADCWGVRTLNHDGNFTNWFNTYPLVEQTIHINPHLPEYQTRKEDPRYRQYFLQMEREVKIRDELLDDSNNDSIARLLNSKYIYIYMFLTNTKLVVIDTVTRRLTVRHNGTDIDNAHCFYHSIEDASLGGFLPPTDDCIRIV